MTVFSLIRSLILRRCEAAGLEGLVNISKLNNSCYITNPHTSRSSPRRQGPSYSQNYNLFVHGKDEGYWIPIFMGMHGVWGELGNYHFALHTSKGSKEQAKSICFLRLLFLCVMFSDNFYRRQNIIRMHHSDA